MSEAIGLRLMRSSRQARLCVQQLEQRITPTAGQLDPSFGNGGLVTTRFTGPSADRARATAIDGLGRVILVGETKNGLNEDFAISRYTAAGALDTSFGGTGIVVVDFGGSDDRAYGVAIDSANRVVVAGFADDGYYGSEFAVARLTAAGALDTTFDGDGKQKISFGGDDDVGNGVAVDAADRVVIVGYPESVFGDRDFAVARLTATGALDNSFDGDGKKTFAFGANEDVATCAAVDHSGRVVVAGYALGDFAVARLTDSGAFDSSFDGDGKRTINVGSSDQAHGVAIDSMNRIVIAGTTLVGSYSDFAVVRLFEIGVPDFNFHLVGTQTVDFGAAADDSAGSVAVDSMDRIVVAGWTRTGSLNNDFAVARLTFAGSLDSSFGTGGKSTVAFGTSFDIGYGVAVDSMDRVVVGGFTQTESTVDFAVVRLTSAGLLDSSFDDDGKQTTDLYAVDNGVAYAVAIDSVGRTIVAGHTSNGANDDFVVTRYSTSGGLDPTFGNGGRAIIDFDGANDYAYAVTLDSLDRIIVAGQSDWRFGVARLNVDGTLDTSFDVDGKLAFLFGNSSSYAYANSVTTDSLGRIIVAGLASLPTNSDMAVARLLPNGMLDSSFDGDGKRLVDFTTSYDSAYAVATDSQDRIVIAGSTNNGAGVARLTTAGALDTSFDTDGKQSISGSNLAYGVAVDSANRIVVASSTGFSYTDFLVSRFTDAGVLDSSFDSDGKQTIVFGPSTDTAYAVAVDSTDRVVVAGESFTGSKYTMAVARLRVDGTLDSSFDSDGKQLIDFGGSENTAYGVAVDSLGRVIVAGSVDSKGYVFAVARLTGDTPPAKFASITVNNGSPQRSMVTSLKVSFDAKVSFVGAAADAFQLTRQSDNASVVLAANVDASGTFLTLTFTGGAVDLGGSLADGRYTLKILASQFAGLGFDGNGNGLADLSPADDYVESGSPNSTNKLFRLFGDADGNGVIDGLDYSAFRTAFNTNSSIFSFDGAGPVDGVDFGQFRQRFGLVI